MCRDGLLWIVLAAGFAAALGARPYAGSWNDGSRLASVESLVDRGTFRIDDSVYVQPRSSAIPPYSVNNPIATRFGTFDKLLIDGHYYSDKSPLPSVVMAGPYWLWRSVGGASATERPDWFARGMSWLFAGVPFVLTVFCLGRACRWLDVPRPWSWIIPGCFAFGTVSLAYSFQVNNHILLLAVAAAIGETMVRRGPMTWRRAIWLGALTGGGYSIDLGAGPVLVLAVGGWMLVSNRRHVFFVILGALPFMAAHHLLNYAIGGTIGPANANPAYLQWPLSPFTTANMTGGWNHSSPTRGFLYALELLVGKKGLLLYSPPMVLSVLAGWWLFRRGQPERWTIAAFAVWAVGTWLLYSATSRNMSGNCLSIRWLVPLIAPGMIVLAILIRDVPWLRRPLLVLIAGGVILNLEFAWRGPWWGLVPTLLWPVAMTTLATWAVTMLLAPEYRHGLRRLWPHSRTREAATRSPIENATTPAGQRSANATTDG